MRDKPGGAAIGVTIGDFADAHVPGEFSLAYLVFNTINNLTTQDAQVACFVNAAAHLQPGGSFVIEVGVPALRLFRRVSAPSRSTSARSTGPTIFTTVQRSR